MIGRRSILGGLMSMIGGLPRPRPDQQYNPPGTPGPVGGAAGTLRARRVIIVGTNGGQFVYSPTAAFGNLIETSGIAAPGTDQYNNAFLAGNTTYATAPMTKVAIQVVGGQIGILTAPSAAGPWTLESSITRNPTSPFGLNISTTLLNLTTANGVSIQGNVTASGEAIETGRVDVNPAATAPPALPAGAEPWNAVAFVNGWLNAAGRTSATYRFVASPPAEVEIRGGITVPAGFAAGQTIFTLPAAYRPADVQSIIAVDVTTGAVVRLAVDNTGNVNYESGAAAAGNVIDYHWLISLDA